MSIPDSLSLAQARRITLAAQGFTDPRPAVVPDARHARRVIRRLGQIQIDSVNILARAHFLPLYSRLGPYPHELLGKVSTGKKRDLFEYWGHEASLIDVRLQPHLRWRMAEAHTKAWGGMRRIAEEKPELVAWVLAEVAAKGPLTSREIEHDVPKARGSWWNWSEAKRALEYLFWAGEVTSSHRNGQFERVYDLPSRSLPSTVVDTPDPSVEESYKALVEVAARALGVAAEPELRDYFRLPAGAALPAIEELVAEGVLRPVTVEGWKKPAWLHAEAKLPRWVKASTLVSPFDPLVWERGRTERLFAFRYRLEIYTPAEKRVHGYYVLPFLHGDRLAARVDLKADRAAGVLRVPAAWLEPGSDAEETATALAAELHRMASWLGLPEVAFPDRGDLAAELTKALI
ncbi:winged helix-turn-helix domain-containing protein [Longispora albida]|uniref:winged helix-turn-helix domain-containing protein n=1 Tax=Longispora albida TaxID=203523 RepID=UPI000376AB3D|nr:crosslink repair DNA glycosylase YcaQ family protein [Longispora albida]